MRGESVEAGFRLGPWRVRPTLNRLVRDGETAQVEPKVMAVLVALAREPGEVVGRDQLLDLVWGTRNVSPDLPRRAVYALRRVFGDDPKRPAFIETIPRVGYRLVESVILEPPGVARVEASPEDRSSARPKDLRGRYAGLAAVALAILAATAASSRFSQSDRPAIVSRVVPRVVPLTSAPGLEYDPALSPDGHRVAFVRSSDDGLDPELTLHVQLVDESTSLELTTEPASFDYPIESPTWSPDGTHIAYLRWRSQVGWAVFEVPALGGPERQRYLLGTAGASGLDWSPAGDELALGLRRAAGEPLTLHRLSRATGALDALTQPPPASVGDHHPAWSPDGSMLAHVRTLVPDASEVRVVPAGGGPGRSLLGRRHKIAALDWEPGGRHLVVAVHDGGRHRLWRVKVADGTVEALDDLGHDTRFVSLARHADRLVYSRTEYTYGLHQLDLETGVSRPRPALSSTFFDAGLDFAPDGTRLVMTSTRAGKRDIWISDLDGRRPVRLTHFEGDGAGNPRWLPGGRVVVFHAAVDGAYDLWTVDTDGGPPRRLTRSPAEDRVPAPLPDGRSIVFASNRSGGWQLWRLPTAGGDARPVTRNGGYRAQASADGDWLYHTRWQVGGLWRVPTAGGEARPVLDERALPAWAGGLWAVAGEHLYYVTLEAENRVAVARVALDGSRATDTWPLDGVPVQPSLAVTPDRRSIYFTQLDRLESDLMLVER